MDDEKSQRLCAEWREDAARRSGITVEEWLRRMDTDELAVEDLDVWKLLEVITGQMVKLSARVDELEKAAAR